ncbi:calmodulin-binding transcription activator [Chrysochromulina tobinii]|uniref:Calmodulin-binding transcription activator n=1 Tax=Chrysochromulina tobinii TaxID=1460289 RepID=A0A0M0K067_9EUKA|nr:calmodulin-binding transcription activator [Chrysochromulina tobinii]|eukprot:KOO32286.1 calmodulin-binding transcription activator [Chrysochromulina sp. CCMP291]
MFLSEAAPLADGATDEDRALLDGMGLDALMIDAVGSIVHDAVQDGDNEMADFLLLTGVAKAFFLFCMNAHKNSFRKDGHDWKMKKNGKQAAESHVKLSVEGVERVKCYYAHTQDGLLARRIYSLIEGDEDLHFRPDLRLVEVCPAWDYVSGGARVLVAALTKHGCRYGGCFGSASAAPAEVGAR